MSTLEAVAARVLPQMILYGRGEIQLQDSPMVAAWAQKTALVSMLVSSRKEREDGYGLPVTEYRTFFEARANASPLPYTMAWIGRYEGKSVRASTCVTPIVVGIEGAAPPDTPQGYLVTIILGKLLLQLFHFTSPMLAVELKGNESLSQLWPSTSEPVRLPEAALYDKQILKTEKGAAIRSHLSGLVVGPWRTATDLPESTLTDSMVKTPTPCGKHFVFYPASLAVAAMRGTSHAFPTSCECSKGYLVVTESTGAHFKLEGSREAVAKAYEGASGEELCLADENGPFWCKRLHAPWELGNS